MAARSVSRNVGMFLPRNLRVESVVQDKGGDVVEVESPGIGILRNTIADEEV